MAPRPEVPRSVKPRREHKPKRMPVMAIADGYVHLENGAKYLESMLPGLVLSEPSSIIACHNADIILKRLDEYFDDNPLWQFKLVPRRHEWETPETSKRKVNRVNSTVVSFFGFKRRDGNGKSKYHYPIDPLVFCNNKTARKLYPEEKSNCEALLKFGVEVREFCIANGLRISPTSGGIAGQLLRDKRFYPEDRRKVPRATNEKARPNLPGNYYELRTTAHKYHKSALYLDQINSHHKIAQEIDLPDANSLFARGRFFNPEQHKIWLKPSNPKFNRILNTHKGLLRVRLQVPYISKDRFPPPYMRVPGERIVNIYTNELSTIHELGGRITALIAAWTSPDTDEGIKKYARWATKEITESKAPWKKATLHAAYGVLAAQPRQLEFGYKRAKGGQIAYYRIGGGMVKVKARRTTKVIEMPTVNVIQRGMIEAETRNRSLALARELTRAGATILAVYADSIFVDVRNPPLLPDTWQIKGELHNLRFLNSVSFISMEVTKLPGVPDRDVMSHLNRLRRIHPKTKNAQIAG